MTKKVWKEWQIRCKLHGDNQLWLERAVQAICRCHAADASRGFYEHDVATGLRLGRLLQRGFRLGDLPALNQWATRQMLKYAGRLTRIANGGD